MEEYVNKMVTVATQDGRIIVGLLKGHDQTANVVLQNCVERVFSTQGVECVSLGLYIIRGDNIAVVGELDESADAEQDLSAVRAAPLQPVVY